MTPPASPPARPSPAKDMLPAAALAAAGLAGVWLAPLTGPGFPGPPGAATAAVALMAVGVAMRRVRPLAALGLVTASAVVQHGLAAPESQIAFETLPALLLVVYAVAARADRVRGLQALGAVLLLKALQTLDQPSAGAADDLVGFVVLLSVVWLAGDAVRRRQERILELELERESRAAAAVEAERRRIAREMHDVIAHALSVMVVQAGAARQTLEAEPAETRRLLESSEATGREALGEMRRLLGLVRRGEAPREPVPGLSDLPALVDRFRSAGLPVNLEAAGPADDVPPGVDLAAYRVVQEGLTNALRHGGGAATTVSIRREDERLHVAVCNGAGPERTQRPGERTGGHGLAGLRERLALYGGRLEAGRAEDGGYRLGAEIPL